MEDSVRGRGARQTGLISELVGLFGWILSPVPFLTIRLVGDVFAAAFFLLTRDFLAGAWFAIVALATFGSAIFARRREEAFNADEAWRSP